MSMGQIIRAVQAVEALYWMALHVVMVKLYLYDPIGWLSHRYLLKTRKTRIVVSTSGELSYKFYPMSVRLNLNVSVRLVVTIRGNGF